MKFNMKFTTAFLAVFVLSCLLQVEAQLSGHYFRENLTLRIIIRYPESKLTSQSPPLTTDLYIVGNGLGLVWNAPTKLSKSAGVSDTWSIDLKFKGDLNGYSCSECVHNQILPVQTKFEYRILTSDVKDMVGPNFGLLLHSTSKMEPGFPISEHVSYPYFFTKQGSTHSVDVPSANQFIGTRTWNYYLPASFSENPYKTYPTIFVLDLNANDMDSFAKTRLNSIFYDTAIAEESVIIGTSDYGMLPDNINGRTELLTPTPGINWYCNSGNFVNQCHGCYPENLSSGDREWKEYMRDGCGYPSVVGGHGEEFLDSMVLEVLPVIQKQGNNRLRIDRDLGISGCSLGGLLACHAIWTRPETFGLAACQSSSFWWPSQVNAENGFYFLNHTVKETHLGARPPQKIYIDVSELEDDVYYAQVGAAFSVAEAMSIGSLQLRKDETLFFDIGNGQDHSNENCFSRTWLYLPLLSPPGGSSRNLNPPLRESLLK